MKEPVLASDGYTYEKEAITQWLRTNTQSPMTREPIRLDGCRPNRALRDAIERWEKEKHQPTGKPKSNIPKRKVKESLPVYQANTVESDHMYAIMIQTQDTVEQIKRSSSPSTPVILQQTQQTQQTQQIQRSLTDEQKRKYAMAVCFLFSAIIILIFVVDRMQANASSS